jgi:hypothetical protein
MSNAIRNAKCASLSNRDSVAVSAVRAAHVALWHWHCIYSVHIASQTVRGLTASLLLYVTAAQVQALHAATLAGPGTPALAQALNGLCNTVTVTAVTPDTSNAAGSSSSGSSGAAAAAAAAAAEEEANHVQCVAEELLSQALLGDG